MDSSSEESFAWTDASNDSSDNETMAKTKRSVSPSGEESESGNTYKKKLQQRLFTSDGDEDASSELSLDEPRRKRKLSRHHSDADNIQSPKKKRVKVEPDSDVDKPKKKKSQESQSQNANHDLYDEAFLNSKVKSEKGFAVPSPIKVKKNKKNASAANDNHTSVTNGDVNEPKMHSFSDSEGLSNSQITLDDSSTPGSSHAEEERQSNYNKTKTKNNKIKKRKKSSSSEVDMLSSVEDESLQIDETAVPKRHISISEDGSDRPGSTHHHVKQNKLRTTSTSNHTENHTSSQGNSESLFAKRKSKMSERIQFEDEDDSDVQTKSISSKIITVNSTDSKKLTSFIGDSSLSLRPVGAKLPSSLIVTGDDDVWLIRCPKEVRPNAFQDKKWVLDSKCKIKLDSQAYVGDIGDTKTNMTILSSEKNRVVIKNVTINGCIRLRRRLPKAAVCEDGTMVNNRANFIPLPDTKCRHPLFGLHYKKAMKLPPAVAERLRAALPAAPAAPRARPRAPKQEEGEGGDAELTVKKKKKKRKHSAAPAEEVAPDAAPPRRKRARALETAEAWDSEKAIEDNLFNF